MPHRYDLAGGDNWGGALIATTEQQGVDGGTPHILSNIWVEHGFSLRKREEL